MQKAYDMNTEILYGGKEMPGAGCVPEAPPLYLSTAFHMDDLEDLARKNDDGGYTYSRLGNPNRDSLASAITVLERSESSLVFSSGMAAIATSLLALLRSGDHIVVNASLYGETMDFINTLVRSYDIAATYADFTDLENIRQSLQPNTRLLYTEVISNPMTNLIELPAISRIAKENELFLVVDSTFTPPYVIRPLEHGADLSIHSLTKYFGGHSDATAGSASGRCELIQRIYDLQILLGTTGDPFSAWMILRGMRTLGLRLTKQMENAARLAAALEGHPAIRQVNHPSLSSHPQHSLAEKLLVNGFGAMLSFSVMDDRDKINAFLRRLQIARYVPTLGGYTTTLSHPVSSSHMNVPPSRREHMGIHEGLLRVSVGIEDIRDLEADFANALEVFLHEG